VRLRLHPLVALGAVAIGSLVICPAVAAPAAVTLSADDRDALTRVAVAEAANQGDSGITAVVQTILNRLASGRWGVSVEAVVDAPHQFEPVARVGGNWRRLPAPSEGQRARIDTILALIADGRLPDFIGGALYFQNPKIVADRIAAGAAPAERLNFGGRAPVAVIRDHAFYADGAGSVPAAPPAMDLIFIASPTDPSGSAQGEKPVQAPSSAPVAASPQRGLFILPDGRLAEDAGRLSGTP
jgi:N-acetylmuramoyl-L-alanine amidase